MLRSGGDRPPTLKAHFSAPLGVLLTAWSATRHLYLIQSLDHSCYLQQWRIHFPQSLVSFIFQKQRLISLCLDISHSCHFFFVSSFEVAGGSNFLFFFWFPGLTESYLAALHISPSFFLSCLQPCSHCAASPQLK